MNNDIITTLPTPFRVFNVSTREIWTVANNRLGYWLRREGDHQFSQFRSREQIIEWLIRGNFELLPSGEHDTIETQQGEEMRIIPNVFEFTTTQCDEHSRYIYTATRLNDYNYEVSWTFDEGGSTVYGDFFVEDSLNNGSWIILEDTSCSCEPSLVTVDYLQEACEITNGRLSVPITEDGYEIYHPVKDFDCLKIVGDEKLIQVIEAILVIDEVVYGN